MIKKEDFIKDKEKCEIPLTHIEEGITDSSLQKIDELFGAADVLSIEYGKKHERNLKIISIFAATLAFFFLLYEAAELHLIIVACVIMIILLYYCYTSANNQKSHEKYLEYRLLAESLRIQYYLAKSGVKKHVSELMPWFIKIGNPWIIEILSELPKTKTSEKKPILNCWIRDQEDYHNKAHISSREKKEKEARIEKIALIITVLGYIGTLIFEFYMLLYSPFPEPIEHLNRAILKIIIGIMSVITIFISNYYGKMSLSRKIEEHRRMALLYDKAKKEILQKGEESEELLVFLAREFLIENATWYAHQKGNKIDLNIE